MDPLIFKFISSREVRASVAAVAKIMSFCHTKKPILLF